jgi:Zn-dependent membrane protease YugP
MFGWIIFGVFALLSWLISMQLRNKFKQYSGIPVNYGLTGREVAEKMLADHGIYDVKVQSVDGELTDHYNPLHKTVNLSRVVYGSNSVAAAAVAAHECGHAVQHAKAYSWLTLRSSLVPAVSFTSKWVQWVILAGIIFLSAFPQLLLIGIILLGVNVLFSFITLPVEINASQRALTWLTNAGITSYATFPKAKSALKWAAYTYVVAALGALGTLLYYLMIFLGQRD